MTRAASRKSGLHERSIMPLLWPRPYGASAGAIALPSVRELMAATERMLHDLGAYGTGMMYIPNWRQQMATKAKATARSKYPDKDSYLVQDESMPAVYNRLRSWHSENVDLTLPLAAVRCRTGYVFLVYANSVDGSRYIKAGCFRGTYKDAMKRWGKDMKDPRAKRHYRYQSDRKGLAHVHAILAYFRASKFI